MKKAIKIAAMFVLLISIFTLSASAKNKTIEWDYYSDGMELYTYADGGELKLGNNEIAPVGKPDFHDSDDFFEDKVYYEFNVEKSGYYSVEILGDLYYTHYVPKISQDIRDGIVYGEKEYLLLNNNDYTVYLEEGCCIFGIDFWIYEPYYSDGIYDGGLNIEFVAEKISDVQIDNESLEDIILGQHIDPEHDENSKTYIPATGKIIFSNGKEFTFDQYIGIEYPENVAPGKNEIIFVFREFKKAYSVDLKTIEDYIESVEIRNLDEIAVVTQTFIPDYVFTPDRCIDLVINKTDGTKLTDSNVYFIYSIQLKGGKSLSLWFDYIQDESGKWYFVAYSGEKELLREPCITINASFESNLNLFTQKISDYVIFMLTDFAWYMSEALDIFSGQSAAERSESISDAFNAVRFYSEEILNLIKLFVKNIK